MQGDTDLKRRWRVASIRLNLLSRRYEYFQPTPDRYPAYTLAVFDRRDTLSSVFETTVGLARLLGFCETWQPYP